MGTGLGPTFRPVDVVGSGGGEDVEIYETREVFLPYRAFIWGRWHGLPLRVFKRSPQEKMGDARLPCFGTFTANFANGRELRDEI